MQKALFKGILHVGDSIELDCAVLEDKTRVLSERAMTKALGGKRGGSHWQRKKTNEDGSVLPVYLSAKNLAGFIDSDLKQKLISPIEYISGGGHPAFGIEATLVPQICDVFLKARRENALLPSQEHMAQQAEALISSFAKIGIIALIDEATGYQEQRDRDELSILLSRYLSEEKLKWARIFPKQFYQLIYKLRGWDWPPVSTSKRPGIIGKYTNDIVYDRLPQGVLERLQKMNPTNPNTHRRKYKHTQFLTEDLGQPDLKLHLAKVITIMRLSRNWEQFMRNLERILPKGRIVPLYFDDIDI